MYSLIQESGDPYFNLATEEYLLHERHDDFLILFVNSPSVIIGKHQVTHREVNTRFTGLNNIPVIRRISGGGAVYHDHGNLNFAFIRQSETGKQVDFRYYTQPVINFLGSLGITAVFEGKNDLTVDGLKISGNAEHVFRERVLHHGTLLFNASVEKMKLALKPASDKYSSRGVESNRTSVVNLSTKLKGISSTEELMSEMLRYFRNTIPGISPFNPGKEELEKIRIIAENRYRTWEWNYAYGPQYIFSGRAVLNGIEHTVRFLVKDGIIWESNIDGSNTVSCAAKKMIGLRHMPDDLMNIFKAEKINITEDELYSLF